MWINIVLIVVLIVIARNRGLKNTFEVVIFTIALFISLKGVFQFLF